MRDAVILLAAALLAFAVWMAAWDWAIEKLIDRKLNQRKRGK